MDTKLNTALARIARPQIRKLARQGKLVDEAFKVFRAAAFPGATPDQVHAMRVCFFAGAAEIWALTMVALDEGQEETDGDLDFMDAWTGEVERYHRRTIAAMMAGGSTN